MYHYQESGLNNVYLVNGYKEIDTPYGKATSITDVAGLNRAIAHNLITYKPRLTGSEFRFCVKKWAYHKQSWLYYLAIMNKLSHFGKKKAIAQNGQVTC